MEDFVEISISVLEAVHHARVRKNTTIAVFKDEIFREFEIDNTASEAYSLFLKGNDRPLPPGATLAQLDIQPQDELEFNYTRRSIRRPLSKDDVAYLRDERFGIIYEIHWQPALIGRPDIDPDHNLLLVVNLESHPDGNKVSRRHAQIIVSNGKYYIENLSSRNPTYLNNDKDPIDRRREIHPGDRICISRACIELTFLKEIPGRSAPSTPKPADALPEVKTTGRTDVQGISQPSLTIERSIDHGYQGMTVNVSPLPFRIGRESCDLTLRDDTVSRRHSEISSDPNGRYFITDLHSANGVIINNVRIPPDVPFEIRNGMLINLGANTMVRFNLL